MAELPKTVDVKVKLNLSLSDHALRVVQALDANNGVLLPTINQLMAEAWEEGGKAAIEREHTYGAEEKAKFSNPYLKGATS